MSRRLLFITVVLLLCVAILPFNLLLSRAQDTITLSLAIPSNQADAFNDKLIAAFEADNPGLKLNIVKADAGIGSAAQNLETHLEAVEKYVQTADVVTINVFDLSPEATRAGYFLDLAPLTIEDTTLNPDDFFPSVWQSFQWDRGIWALPNSVDSFVLLYKPDVFDKAGLPYPTDQWTIDDLENAIRTLAVKDSEGKVTSTGMDVSNFILPFLLRIASNEKLYDDSTIPNTPRLDTPTNQALLERWKKLEDEGYVGEGFNTAPMEINAAITILVTGLDDPAKKSAGVLMFGKAGLATQGFAVSAGTQHPEQAYKLASWLTTRAEIITTGLASTPARQSLVGKQGADAVVSLNVSPEVQALIDKAIQNGLPPSELRYADYLGLAYSKMKTENLDAASALRSAEDAAIKAQNDAAAKKGNLTLNVATPVPVAGAPGLKFALVSLGGGGSDYPNKEHWEKAIADFESANADAGKVVFEKAAGSVSQIAEAHDCFYLPYNAVHGTEFSSLLSLDPYLSADSTFDKSDMIASVLSAVTRDNKVYALPVDIQPNVLRYNTEKFTEAGVAEPQGEWTTDVFVDTLKQLKVEPKDPAPFAPVNTFGAYTLSLVASFGGVPLDYRTNPPTVNYTDPKTVEAIRQVLDLARDGYIRYVKLGDMTMSDFALLPPVAALTQESLGAFSLQRAISPNVSTDPKFKYIIYPKGTDFSAVTYNLGALYISATSQKPEACYKFISHLAQNPKLFSSMPPRLSLINSPELATTQGESIVSVYKTIAALMQEPTTISIPTLNASDPTGGISNTWLYRAMDAYVLEDKDLETELQEAQLKSNAFQECQAKLPPLDMSSTDAQKTYLRGFLDCLVKADPSMKTLADTLKVD